MVRESLYLFCSHTGHQRALLLYFAARIKAL